MRIFKEIFTLFIFLQAFTPFLFPQVPAKEQVTDTVRCRDAAGQSYALFQPAQYDNKKSWPVILIFDPAARGRTGVNTFIEAARKYGFILACSNNSRNGPQGDNFTAAAAMLQDVEERFNVDQKRIYASGFSGGSRFAMAFAVTEKRISGVIGCGAGLPNDRNYLPISKFRFLILWSGRHPRYELSRNVRPDGLLQQPDQGDILSQNIPRRPSMARS